MRRDRTGGVHTFAALATTTRSYASREVFSYCLWRRALGERPLGRAQGQPQRPDISHDHSKRRVRTVVSAVSVALGNYSGGSAGSGIQWVGFQDMLELPTYESHSRPSFRARPIAPR
jgi:hypothetical protein